MSDSDAPQFPEFRILSSSELTEVYEFSRVRADKSNPFVEWTAPWRKESLEHYLKLGWSMARRDVKTGQLLGYILAQPVLFFRRHTQSVWVEHIEASTPALESELLDTIVRIAREKHMQRVLMQFGPISSAPIYTDQGLGEVIRARNGRMIEDDILEFATTKS